MISILSMFAPLLQSRFDTQFISKANTNTVVVAVVIIVGLIVVLIIAGSANDKSRSRSSGGGKRYSRGGFRRRARQLGLTKAHVKTLEFIKDKYQVKTPMALLANSRQLDFYLGKAISDIDAQVADDDVKESQKLTLYRIKQIIERNAQRSVAYTNSKQLKAGQELSIEGEDGVRYRSRIVTMLKDGLAIEVPMTDSGEQIRWKKWSPVVVNFWKSNGEGFSFQSKASGYNIVKGVPIVIVQHSNKIQAAKQRRFRRKELENPCYFTPVQVMTLGTGRNRQKKAFVDKKRAMLGTIIEVSVGGCSVRATRPLVKGSLVKVDFETERSVTVSSYGKVVNTRKESSMGSIMHIMFTRVSRKNLNRINSYIYEYGTEERVR